MKTKKRIQLSKFQTFEHLFEKILFFKIYECVEKKTNEIVEIDENVDCKTTNFFLNEIFFL